MKKFFRSLIVIAAATALVSFQVGDTPQEVAVKFTKAMGIADFDSSKMYVTLDGVAFLDGAEYAYKNGAQLPDSLKQIIAQATIKATGETKINDSTTNVDISVTLPKPIGGQQEIKNTLVLVKKNGAWKVDLQATMQKAMKDAGMSSDEQSPPADSTEVDTTATQ